ncbi:hypothetical protein K3495_g1951 [Podosphaera aphanis]|nr:hypothetical protein K3495_g1951 [Podosphaera aphanis]
MTTITKTQKPLHPYLQGNFAPIRRIQPLTQCEYNGHIPQDLAGGEYVRNGGNPIANKDLGRDAHWFDGDGMLSGVTFRKMGDGSVQPYFVCQYILTDVYLSAITSPLIRLPILPSIATLVNPASTIFLIIKCVIRTLFLVLLSNMPGSQQQIRKISVANTGILFHDGRALATCESGPPMRVLLPGLETIGWFDGLKVEAEPVTETLRGEVFGGDGLLSFMKEWTTAHPRVDPITKELILFHSTFFAPFISYSILPSTQFSNSTNSSRRLVNAPVPGIKSAKMTHDMGISRRNTVVLDLPLSLDPRNLIWNKPVISYDPSGCSRFGVFPRWSPEAVRWFETSPCCIFHTANTWDEEVTTSDAKEHEVHAVNMLACRLTSATLVFSAGNIAAPTSKLRKSIDDPKEEEQCCLYYYRFVLSGKQNIISHQFALSSIPFEFPSLCDEFSMSEARYIYGCSVSDNSFGAALGRSVKVDCLVKIDCINLIERAKLSPPVSITGCIDRRSVAEILSSSDIDDPIKIFRLPQGFYAQEPRFVRRKDGKSEDDGWILSYVFDESQLDQIGNAKPTAKSELWIIDAKGMKEVVCKVYLPQRVPYGLHGKWFSEEEISQQRKVETTRNNLFNHLKFPEKHVCSDDWSGIRNRILKMFT